MTEQAGPTIGDIEAEFRDDLVSERFDQYLFVTYNVDKEYLEQFGPSDSVLLCGPDQVGDVVNAVNVSNVDWKKEEAHAKCYLMWNDESIKAWLGSFNLTETGLRTSIEWGVAHEVSLDTDLSLHAIRDGTCRPETVTSDVLVQQLLDVFIAILSHGTPALTAALRSTPQTESVNVLTNGAIRGTNGFHDAIEQILAESRGDIQLTYFTPFVTAAGVHSLTDAVPTGIDDTDINLEIRTCRIEAVDDPDSYLDQATLERLDARYGSVRLLARASGTAGQELPDQKLRSGMAHFKLLVVNYTGTEGGARSSIILTSANLSENAWGHDTNQLEFGLWVRNQELRDRLVEFYCGELAGCYSEPNQLDFETLSALESPDPLLRDRSLLDQLSSRLTVSETTVQFGWAESDPPLESVEAELFFNNLISDEQTSETTTLRRQPSDNEYVGQFDGSHLRPGWVIDRVELRVTTTVYPTEYEVTKTGKEELVVSDSVVETIEALAAHLDSHSITGDRLIVNDSHIIENKRPLPSVDSVQSVRVRRRYDSGTRTFVIPATPDTQPHLDSSPLVDFDVRVETIDRVGGFGCVTVTAADKIQLKHDMLSFTDQAGAAVEYLGYAEHDTSCTYAFDASVAGTKLTVQLASPYDVYFSDPTHEVSMPADIPELDPRIRCVCEETTYRFTHQPNVSSVPDADQSDKYITSNTPINIAPASELAKAVDTPDRLSYEWRRRTGGYNELTQTPLSEPIAPLPAHSQVEYCGLVSIDSEGDELSLRTPMNRFRVRQKVFDTDVSPDPKTERKGRNLDAGPDAHLSWLVFTSDSLLRNSVSLGPNQSIDMDVTVDSASYDCSHAYPVSAVNEMFFIPLFGRHMEGTVTVSLRLDVRGGGPSYGSSELIREFQHEPEKDGVLRTEVDENGDKKSQIKISHYSDQTTPQLGMYQDQIYSKKLKGYLERDDAFKVERQTATKLIIEAKETTVLRLGPAFS